jgi:hypothetical protein
VSPVGDDVREERARAAAIVQVQLVEYSALRTELLVRSSQKYQQLTLAGGVAALLTGFAGTGPVSAGVAYTLAGVIGVVGGAAWFDAGRAIGRLSRRLAQIEHEVNLVMQDTYAVQDLLDTRELLRWELAYQDRGRLGRLLYGPGQPPATPRPQR